MTKNAKPGRQFKLEKVRVADVPLPFLPTLRGTGGTYLKKLTALLEDPSSALKILHGDNSTLTQLRSAAAKLKIRLLYATDGQYCYVRIFRLTEKQREILTLLDTGASTINALKQIKDCDVVREMRELSEIELVKLDRDSRWNITEAGRNELIASGKTQEQKP